MQLLQIAWAEALVLRDQLFLVLRVGIGSLAISTIRSSRRGRNSCSGGSRVRMVTGNPSMARKTPTKSAALHGQQFLQRGAAVFLVVGENHGAHVRQAVLGEEHVLGAAQADAFGAERARLDGIARNVGIGANPHAAERLGPAHELQQLGIVGRRRQGFSACR